MPYFHHDGIDFFYTEEGEGRPFVFQHGLGGNVDQPTGLYRSVPGIRRLSFDARGHGKTRSFGSEEKFNFTTFSHDLLAFIDQLKLDRIVVGGISMGAGIALRFALTYPERVEKLILSRVAWENQPQPEEVREAFTSVAKMVQEWGPVEGEKRFKDTPVYKNMKAQSSDAANSLLKQFRYEYIDETWQKLIRIPSDVPFQKWGELQKIEIPTLILANRVDPIHPYEYGRRMAKEIKQVIFKELTPKSISEQAHTEQTQQYIRDFLL